MAADSAAVSGGGRDLSEGSKDAASFFERLLGWRKSSEEAPAAAIAPVAAVAAVAPVESTGPAPDPPPPDRALFSSSAAAADLRPLPAGWCRRPAAEGAEGGRDFYEHAFTG